MSRVITVKDFALQLGQRQLVAPVSFSIPPGAKIGLVGRNGAGKTTTMRILAGQTEQGVIQWAGDVARKGIVAYLPQDTTEGDLEQSAHQRIVSVRGLDKLMARIKKAEHEMSNTEGARQQKAMERYVRLDHEFTQAGGWAADAQAAQIGAALGIDKNTMKQPLGTLSGGQRRRVELARVLFSDAETILLDEPTNHLDHDSILWLRDWIREYSGGLLMITHDVGLLDKTVNQVFYLDAKRGELDMYRLGWAAYLKQRAEDEQRRRKERTLALKKAAELQMQGEKMRAKATKAAAAQQMLRRAAQLREEAGEEEVVEKVARIRFPEPSKCGKVPLQGHGLSKSYGSLEVFSGVDLAVDRGGRVVILGLNGAGKTTLLKILAGVEAADTGEVEPGHGLRLGYYAQEHDTLRLDLTVEENMRLASDMDDTDIRSVLGQFLFSGDDVEKLAAVLSGGEKTRLALATLVASGANVLLLDEPTNNLDPASREEILQALRTYEGAVVLVTHDPGAVQALDPQRVLLLPDGDEDLWDESYLDLVTLT